MESIIHKFSTKLSLVLLCCLYITSGLLEIVDSKPLYLLAKHLDVPFLVNDSPIHSHLLCLCNAMIKNRFHFHKANS